MRGHAMLVLLMVGVGCGISEMETAEIAFPGRGPVVIGGVGGSGTRGVWELLEQLGVDLCKDCSDRRTRDSNMFNWDFEQGYLLEELYNETHTFAARGVSDTSSQLWDKILKKTRSSIKDHRHHSAGPGPVAWGWKRPRAMFLLPFFEALMGSSWKYIHVVRDGRDIAGKGSNAQFNSFCRHSSFVDVEPDCANIPTFKMKLGPSPMMMLGPTPPPPLRHTTLPGETDRESKRPSIEDFLGPRPTTSDKRRQQTPGILRYWQTVNSQVDDWAREMLAPSGRYLMLNIENITLEPQRCADTIVELAKFVGVALPSEPEALRELAEQSTAVKVSSHYGGAKFTEEDHREVLSLTADVLDPELFERFGYGEGSWKQLAEQITQGTLDNKEARVHFKPSSTAAAPEPRSSGRSPQRQDPARLGLGGGKKPVPFKFS